MEVEVAEVSDIAIAEIMVAEIQKHSGEFVYFYADHLVK